MIAKDGFRFIIPGLLLTALSLLLLIKIDSCWFLIPLIFFGILTLFIIYFFRDPHRQPPAGDNLILSPGDGKVILIEDHEDDNGQMIKQISIFLSVFNVHINRIPISGKVVELNYISGKFHKAFQREASSENERMEITIESDYGRMRFAQVAGILARRIVCWLKKGDIVTRGERLGLIRFGSRMDIYLPLQVDIKVKIDDLVIGGETIIGEYKTDG